MHKPIYTVLTLVVLICTSCNAAFPSFLATSTPQPTATATVTPSPSPIPTSTPTPTPVPAVRVEQGDWALFSGDYDVAQKEFQNALANAQDDETRAGALVGLGRTQILNGRCDQAITTLKKVTQDYSESIHAADAYYFLGQCYSDQSNPASAASAYQRYLDYRPGVLDAYIQELRGDALFSAADYAGAITAYGAAARAPQLGDGVSVQMKIGKAYAEIGDFKNAIRTFLAILGATSNDYDKAQADLLLGQAYQSINQPEQAYARYQDAVNNYPRSYDSYSGLVELVNDSQPVDDLNRGLVDYFAGQNGLAIESFKRYIEETPDHDGTAHYYMGYALRYQGQYEAAIAEWQSLIKDHSGDRFWSAAWDEIAYTQWVNMDDFKGAAQTLLDFVSNSPSAPEAPAYLYEAARILERSDDLKQAATTWARLIDEYPSDTTSLQALFLSGICYYRLADYPHALTVFQRMLALSTLASDQSQAYFWIGKTQTALSDAPAATASFTQAAQTDPTGYYTERAKEILQNQPPLEPATNYDLGFDLASERPDAEAWLRTTFSIPAETNLSSPGALADDPRLKRGDAFWELGLYSQANDEFTSMGTEFVKDPANSFRLLDHLVNLGFYQLAILTSRQILDAANLDDAGTLSAPVYFTHIRFGPYFKEIILPEAEKDNLPPLLLMSVIRQESLFEGFAESSAGAIGMMQIMPATAKDEVAKMGWPPNYNDSDLYRPVISVGLGAHYLSRLVDLFDGDIFAALAAYNGGPGNAQAWKDMANGDPDLLVEVIRPDETRTYLKQIFAFTKIYEQVYLRQP
jgi:soluble lytic murein transglycosylase